MYHRYPVIFKWCLITSDIHSSMFISIPYIYLLATKVYIDDVLGMVFKTTFTRRVVTTKLEFS